MAIPALSTADKSFICSYVIGSNIDHRKALGIINEITTFTSEYIDGYCWIPANAPQETNEHSWYWDVGAKDTVYVKVGVRVAADGYLHTWLLNTQKVSELILWNNAYNQTNSPPNDTTTLHWCIEKLYRLAWGSTVGFVAANIKFQHYISGATRLYLFGNYSNGLTNSTKYTIDPANVQDSDLSWYPNNATTIISDYIFSGDATYAHKCQVQGTGTGDDWWGFSGPFGKSPSTSEPVFHKIASTGTSASITAICDPTTPTLKTVSLCNRWVGTGTGNNSGRLYTVSSAGTDCMGCPGTYSYSHATVNMSPNVCYVWVPYDPGPPAVPGHYTCCPTFTYDTLVTFNYGKFVSISASQIDYLNGNAQFSGLPLSTGVLANYYKLSPILDSFDEISGDLDELKHVSFVDTIITPDPPGGNEGCAMWTLFTKHVGVGLAVDAAVTIDSADWTVTWGVNDYFSSWSTPDGLALRTPGVPNTVYSRPLAIHDELNDVSGEPCLNGFLYSLLTSNAFLSRDPGTETKSVIPRASLADFGFLHVLATSNAFLGRDPGTEVKIVIPISNLSDFSYLYALVTSAGFLGRSVNIEVKIEYPVGNNSDFCYLYALIEPLIGTLYHLKVGGDDTKDGRSFANAWEHWTYAMANTPADRTLMVMHGTYNDGETNAAPQNSIVIFLVDVSESDAPSTAIVTLS